VASVTTAATSAGGRLRRGGGSTDGDVSVHAHRLVVGHGAVDLVAARLQRDRQRAGLPGRSHPRYSLVGHAGAVDLQGVDGASERARALAHEDHCDDCAAELRQLTALSDDLLGLVPGREPPIGFESRMMSRLGFALGAFNNSGSPTPRVLRSTFTAGDRQVGTIYTATSTPSWVYMTIDTDHGTGTVTCQLQQRDGHIVTLGTFSVTGGYGYWGAPSPVDAATVAFARVVAGDGTVVAIAQFPS